jgi:peptide deformylase
MAEKLKICTYPDPVLRKVSSPIVNIDEKMQQLIDSMTETMYAAPGIGLAAIQVGAPVRLIVYDVCSGEGERNPCTLINPEITLAEGRIVYSEACLSVVEYSADVERHSHIKVRGVDRHGKPLDIEVEGLEAVCLQHEIDHLNGKLFIDHISSLKRSLYKKKLSKMMENQA